MPVLNEHRLRLGDREVTLLEGPAGWGECSPLAGYPSDPAACRRAAEEAATASASRLRCRDSVPVNALVDGPVLVQDVRGFPAVKVKVRDAPGVALVRGGARRGRTRRRRAGRRQRRVGRRHRGRR